MKKLPDQHDEKATLRAELRSRRSLIDDVHRNILDTAINTHMATHVHEAGYRVVAAYVAFDGEPDLSLAMTELHRKNVTLALPVVHPLPGRNTLAFCRWAPGIPLKPNRFGIPEPDGATEVTLPEIDLMLMPVVGWDRAGNRLGMGASYYDRALQPFALNERPLRVGVAYSVQEAECIPAEPWDVPLHAMLTEHGWFTCGD